jgi:nucleoside-diphosphate-sugar epimerase
MRVLVTGGAGYLGSVLVPAMLARDCYVTVLDKFERDDAALMACCHYDRFTAVRGDARDERAIASLMSRMDVIIPLAALVGAPLCARDTVGATTINRDAIRTLLKHSSRAQKIVYPTTNSGYGIGEEGQYCTEATPLRPISLYGITKVEAEDAVLQNGNGITLRLATVFGISPRMRIDLLVNDFTHRAVNDRAVVLFESHFKRNYIHIRDVARAFLHAIDKYEAMNGEPYNVGLSDANLSKRELCERISKQVPGFVFIEAPIGEDPDKRNYIVSNEKIEATGFKTEWSIDRGIAELIKGYTMINNQRHSNV